MPSRTVAPVCLEASTLAVIEELGEPDKRQATGMMHAPKGRVTTGGSTDAKTAVIGCVLVRPCLFFSSFWRPLQPKGGFRSQ